MRPRQWIKNLLVVAAPAGGRRPGRARASLGATLLAFVAFCLASSAVYLVNDCADVEADRRAPAQAVPPDRGR